MARPGIVHRDRVEVADLDADVAAHAAPVIDKELVDDLAALAVALFLAELWVVGHDDRHAFHRAGALTSVAAGAERLDLLEVPEKDGEGAIARGYVPVNRRVLDRHRLAEHGRECNAQGPENADHGATLPGASVRRTEGAT